MCYIIAKEEKLILIAGQSFTNVPMLGNSQLIRYMQMYGKSYKQILLEAIEQVKANPLFEYTGNCWLHKRAQ